MADAPSILDAVRDAARSAVDAVESLVAPKPAHGGEASPREAEGPAEKSIDVSRSALHFPNGFDDSTFLGIHFSGLCGGMSYTVLDLHRAGLPAPAQATAPPMSTALGRYIYRRQVESLLGWNGVRFLAMLANPDDASIASLSDGAFLKVRASIDAGRPVPIGLIPAPWTVDVTKFTRAHQVVATGYRVDGEGSRSVLVWDPNRPEERDTRIVRSPGSSGWSELGGGHQAREWRGFFVEDYEPRSPAAVVDAVERRPPASTTSVVEPPPAPPPAPPLAPPTAPPPATPRTPPAAPPVAPHTVEHTVAHPPSEIPGPSAHPPTHPSPIVQTPALPAEPHPSAPAIVLEDPGFDAQPGEQDVATMPGDDLSDPGAAAGPSRQTTSDLDAELPALREMLRRLDAARAADAAEAQDDAVDEPPADGDEPADRVEGPCFPCRLERVDERAIPWSPTSPGADMVEVGDLGDTGDKVASSAIGTATAACAVALSETGIGSGLCAVAGAIAGALEKFGEWIASAFRDTFHPDKATSEAWLIMMRIHPAFTVLNVDVAKNADDGSRLVRYFRMMSGEVPEGKKGNLAGKMIHNPTNSHECDRPYQCADDPDEPLTSRAIVQLVQDRYQAWLRSGGSKNLKKLPMMVPTLHRGPAEARTILAMIRKYPQPFKAISQWSEIEANKDQVQEQVRAMRILAGEDGPDPGGVLESVFGGKLAVHQKDRDRSYNLPWQQFYPFRFDVKKRAWVGMLQVDGKERTKAELEKLRTRFIRGLHVQGILPPMNGEHRTQAARAFDDFSAKMAEVNASGGRVHVPMPTAPTASWHISRLKGAPAFTPASTGPSAAFAPVDAAPAAPHATSRAAEAVPLPAFTAAVPDGAREEA